VPYLTSADYVRFKSKIEAAQTIEELLDIQNELRTVWKEVPEEFDWAIDSLVLILQKRARQIRLQKKM
jgi:hypothetical protein